MPVNKPVGDNARKGGQSAFVHPHLRKRQNDRREHGEHEQHA
jgi:hypothetical protein